MTNAAKWKLRIQILLAAALLCTAAALGLHPLPARPYREFTALLAAGEVQALTLGEGPAMDVTLRDGMRFQTENPRKEGYKEYLLDQGVAVREAGTSVALGFIAVAALGAGAWALSRRRGKGAMQGYAAMGEEAAVPATTFADVGANDEARASLRGLVDFIQHPDRYAAYGARIPRGVLLYGPPGTGKTLMARALAGEAGVPFYAVSGSDFVQVYVGVGASRVRELFRKARKAGRAVVFIDEIDALGKKRESVNDEREQTLNALLTEMSGFGAQEGVVVLAATNRVDTLDEALLRPGRFDRQVEVALPTRAERLRILQVHAQGKPMAEDVDMPRLAEDTVTFSGAKLEAMLNEAAILAAQRQAPAIDSRDIDRAMRALLVGEDKPGLEDAMEERRVTAAHEAGHAVATLLCQPQNRLARVSVMPSSKGAAGYSMSVPPERLFQTRQDLEAHVLVALAGRAGEELIFGPEKVTTGAANDLQKATELITRMYLEWGMDEATGPLARGALAKAAPLGESEVRAMAAKMQALYVRALALLRAHEGALRAVAGALVAHETLTGQEVAALLDENCRTNPTQNA